MIWMFNLIISSTDDSWILWGVPCGCVEPGGAQEPKREKEAEEAAPGGTAEAAAHLGRSWW